MRKVPEKRLTPNHFTTQPLLGFRCGAVPRNNAERPRGGEAVDGLADAAGAKPKRQAALAGS